MLFLTPAGGRGLLRHLGLLAGMLLACGGARAADPLTLDEAWRLARAPGRAT